jgi:hypothetical protein
LRNELVEEYSLTKLRESHTELDVPLMRESRNKRYAAKRGESERRRGKARKRSHKAPLGEAGFPRRGDRGRLRARVQA